MSAQPDKSVMPSSPRVIDSVTSSVTPEQAFESVDLTDPSSVIQNAYENVAKGAQSLQEAVKAKAKAKHVGTDPKYLIYLDTDNAKLLKEFLQKFAQMRVNLKGRDMMNMELANPEIISNSPSISKDRALTKLLGLAKRVLKDETSDERNQIEGLYAYFAERARSFMFYPVSELLKNSPIDSIKCDLYHTQNKMMIASCKITGINDDLLLAVEVRVPAQKEGDEDSIAYIGISPFESLRPKIQAKPSDIATIGSELYARSSSPDKTSHFDANLDIGVSDKVSKAKEKVISSAQSQIPYISEIAAKVGQSLTGQTGQIGQTGQTGQTAGSMNSTTSSEVSSTPRDYSSAGLIMRGGAQTTRRIAGLRNTNTVPVPQTEIDNRLQELLDQSKSKSKSKNNQSSSSEAAQGLCE